MLGTIDRPTSGGAYLFEGEDISEERPSPNSRKLRRDRLGFVFQSFNLIDELTIGENVALGLAYRSMPARKEEARARRRGDGPGRRSPTASATISRTSLSGGQQQRAAIARAIVGANPS